MARSFCFCEPSIAIAGKTSIWKFVYTPSYELKEGTNLKFDILSLGRDIDWEIPKVNLKNKKNLICAKLPNGKLLKATKIKNNLSTQFEFTLPTKIPSGKPFTILIGNEGKNGNRCQTYTQRKRKFVLYIDPKGKNEYSEKEIFYLTVKGGEFTKLNILTPPLVSRNRRFDVIIRFEDKFGNLTNNADEDTLIEVKYQNLRENLSWKLFVPETGFLAIPNLYFNEAGTYRLELKNLKTKQIFYSNPIKCFHESELSIFFGSFHSESEKIDASKNIENCLRLFRDEKAYSFYCSSPFDDISETSNETWKNIANNIADFNEDFRFITFLGFQWVGSKEEGVRQFIYLKDQKHILRKKDLKTNSLKKIYKIFNPKDIVSIPTFIMSSKHGFDFKDFNPEFEKVVEIYNSWGSCECLEKEGNERPIKGKIAYENPKGSIREALKKNCRFGFVAGGLDDRGIYEKFFDSDQKQYSPGLTAIIAKHQTKDDLFQAIKKRSCYATTGAKIILGFFIAKKPMGSELNTLEKPGLLFNRYISGFVIGTSKLKKIEIIRNGKILNILTPESNEYNFNFNDQDLLSKISLNSKDSPFTYYYIKATQEDGHIAWGSPIWVDLKEKSSKSQ